jgi:hypothetical protein
MLLATLLSVSTPADQAATVFCAVFGIVWIGAAVVTLNAQLLEGHLSFFQSVCVLGYCVFPLCISAFLCQLAQLALGGGLFDMVLRSGIALSGCACATGMLTQGGPRGGGAARRPWPRDSVAFLRTAH